MKKLLSLLLAVLFIVPFAVCTVSAEDFIPSPEQPSDVSAMGIWQSANRKNTGTFKYATDSEPDSGTLYLDYEITGAWKYDEATKSGTFELNNGTTGRFMFDEDGMALGYDNLHVFELNKGGSGIFVIDEGKDIFAINYEHSVRQKYSIFWIVCCVLFACASLMYVINFFMLKKKESKVPAGYTEAMPEDLKKKQRKKSFSKFKNHLMIIVSVVVIILAVVFLMHLHASRNDQTEKFLSYDDIAYNGNIYSRRQDIESILIIGLDKYASNEGNSTELLNNRQSDFLMLVVFDKTDKSYKALQIDRDTMVYIDVLGRNSEKIDTVYEQLALAHSYGKGQEDSCYNTRKTISKLFYDIRIDYVASFTLDTVGIINNALSGVEVTVNDDFSKIDPALRQGEKVTLTDEQAVTFVESRGSLADMSNVNRMARHREFIASAIKKANMMYKDNLISTENVVGKLLPYVVSNLTADQAVRFIETFRGYEFKGFCELDGKFKKGEQYLEFYPNQYSVKEKTVELFYKPKKKGV